MESNWNLLSLKIARTFLVAVLVKLDIYSIMVVYRRSHHAIFVTFDVGAVPLKPRDVALNQIKLKFIDSERLGLVREKFSQRPVWSKNALTAITSIPPDRLKLILPALAYYFTNGPWRNQWIRCY